MLKPWPPTTEIKASTFCAFSRCQQLVGHVHFLDHVVFIDRADMKRIHTVRLAEHARAGRIEASDQLRAQGQQPALGVALRVQQAVEPIADADQLPSQLARRQGRAHDDGIDPRHEAGAHIDGNASGRTALVAICTHIRLS